MITVEAQGRRVLAFKRVLGDSSLRHLFSLRQADGSGNVSLSGGRDRNAAVAERRSLCSALGFDFQNLTVGGQVHGNAVTKVDLQNVGRGSHDPGTVLPASDALLTTLPDIPLLCSVGDCAAILLWAPGPIPGVAVCHGGWRGLAAGILPITVRALSGASKCPPSQMEAGVAPCIGLASFEVGAEVADLAPDSCRRPWHGKEAKWGVDLEGWAWQELHSAGIPPKSLEKSGLDTFRDPERFFSHRRQGLAAGRMGLFAGFTKATSKA